MTVIINLCDYKIVKDSNNVAMLQDGMILLENLTTGVILKGDFAQVADYYGISVAAEIVCQKAPEKDKITQPPVEVIQSDPQPEFIELEYSSFIEEDPDESTCQHQNDGPTETQSPQEKLRWTDGQTRFLLEFYSENLSNIGPKKKFKLKKNMWSSLTQKINEEFNLFVSPLQVETRHRCVMKRSKKIIDNNTTSGEERIEPEFEEELGEIIAKDDSLVPDCILRPGSTIEKRGSETIKKISRPLTNYSPIVNPQITGKSRTKAQQPSTSHSDYCSESRTPINSESGLSIDSGIFTGSEKTSAPKKRVRKSVQEIFCEKFFAEKKAKNEKMEEFLKDRATRKEQRSLQKEEAIERRHTEKLEILVAILKNQKPN